MSSDSRDDEPLTPAHILYPATFKYENPVILATDSDGKENLSSAWRRAQSRINQFWKAWRRDYLSLLHERKKWKKTKDDIKVDDVVIIVDESKARSEWKWGRVVSTIDTGPHTRKVHVKRADKKVVLKDRTKLVRMEMDG